MSNAEILIKWVNYQTKKYLQHFQIAEDKCGLEIDEKKFSQRRKQLNAGPIKTLQQMVEPDYTILITLLMTLAPEAFFSQFRVHQRPTETLEIRQLQVALAFPQSFCATRHVLHKADRLCFILNGL